ncbi:MAG TPA: hypothetical protein VKV28_07240 [Candidatus Binataceae bacterium]|nr:hypothetical protein [Candidatus Binataceae bacterium]
MKTSHRLLLFILAVSVSGCAYVPTWAGGKGTDLPTWMGGTSTSLTSSNGLSSSTETERLSQNLGARVRSNIARANSKGIDTKLALDYQMRGDAALQAGRYTDAAEEYGRAEQALVTSEEIAQAQLNQRQAQLAYRQSQLNGQAESAPHPATQAAVGGAGAVVAPRRRHLSAAYRARSMAERVRREIAQAEAQRMDVSKAKQAQHAGDQAVDQKNYGDAMQAYRRARQELSSASTAGGTPAGGSGANPGP